MSYKGTVKWWNDPKGFGFLTQENGKDIFVHHTSIISNQFRTLVQGEPVEFDVTEGPKGLHAVHVKRLNER